MVKNAFVLLRQWWHRKLPDMRLCQEVVKSALVENEDRFGRTFFEMGPEYFSISFKGKVLHPDFAKTRLETLLNKPGKISVEIDTKWNSTEVKLFAKKDQ
jgi:hypothetical protein